MFTDDNGTESMDFLLIEPDQSEMERRVILRWHSTPSWHQWRHIGQSIIDHARLRFHKGEDARHYNVLQKITYFLVAFVLLPVLVLAGWTMSPGLDAAFPGLLDIFGGRQTARSAHFIAAFGVVLFVLIHLALVLVSGVFNNMRSMITGWYDIGEEPGSHE